MCQGLPYWASPQEFRTSKCSTYRIYRSSGLDQLWSATARWTDCQGVLNTRELYYPEVPNIIVCSSTIPTLTTDAPVPTSYWGVFTNNYPIIRSWAPPFPLSNYQVGEYVSASTSDVPIQPTPFVTERIVFEIHTKMPVGSTGNDLPTYGYLRFFDAGIWSSSKNYSSSENETVPMIVEHGVNYWYARENIVPTGATPSVPSGINPGGIDFLSDGCEPNWQPPPDLPTDLDPEVPTVSCGSVTRYSGGKSFPTDRIITLGSGTGNTAFRCDPLSIPDKFVMYKYDGVNAGQLIYDTGYWGNPINQNNLNNSLAGRGLPPETIVGSGTITYFFTKTSDYTKVLVRVYAPLNGTEWNFSIDCPS